jgi:hypothetical protein
LPCTHLHDILLYSHQTVPRTEVIGDPERYVKSGSSVALRCVVRGALEPPSYIIWYHDAHQLLSENQQKWEIKLSKGTPDSDGDIPNIVSIRVIFNNLSQNCQHLFQGLFVSNFLYCLVHNPWINLHQTLFICRTPQSIVYGDMQWGVFFNGFKISAFYIQK